LIGTEVGGSVLGAGIAGINLLVNKGLADVFGMEATANLLGAQSGTGAQKGIAVAAGLEPLAEKLIKDLGYENPTIDQVERITSTVAKAMADIVNAVPPPAELQDVPAAGTRFAADGANAAQATLTPAPTTGMVTR
jgi:hypothetical protein